TDNRHEPARSWGGRAAMSLKVLYVATFCGLAACAPSSRSAESSTVVGHWRIADEQIILRAAAEDVLRAGELGVKPDAEPESSTADPAAKAVTDVVRRVFPNNPTRESIM